MFRKLLLYLNTIKYLKWTQIRYQLWYKVRSYWRAKTNFKYDFDKNLPAFKSLHYQQSIDEYNSYFGNNNFHFLNLSYNFNNGINWDFDGCGKLWTYNLNYFEFLNQNNAEQYKVEFENLINDFTTKIQFLKNANEPFPTSLRITNWIKYFTSNQIYRKDWMTSLYCQCFVLIDNIEYHLLGNHLLENGFALTNAGIFFQSKDFFTRGKGILEKELNEQILSDGAHFELSPMYHNLMLYRLLDTIQFLKYNTHLFKQFGDKNERFLYFLEEKASIMCSWLSAMMMEDDDIPHFNDSTYNIAPNAVHLLEYAKSLEINVCKISLDDSGYKRLQNATFDILVKSGKIGPDYIPGHAHADSLSFVMYIKNKPFIIDPGITTYEKNKTRQLERSTSNHNTVCVNGDDSSQIWGGFRVGKRSKAFISSYSSTNLEAYHTGYNTRVGRLIIIQENTCIIEDNILNQSGSAFLHFHPDIEVICEKNTLISENVKIIFENVTSVSLHTYNASSGFNQYRKATKATIQFSSKLKSTIKFEDTVFN
ncbi:MAG: alginate lyase family protein [Chitinophagaceae bacterium]|mgnify:CR=1 FL=1|nr:alginate lyase family protein [Chitinophagaceae bacterium]HRO07511.1 alginate lyase family protein [Saprospiraceae bacterium]HRP40794.1 alginate lyase family protein [Saprospiraceae bacterium]